MNKITITMAATLLGFAASAQDTTAAAATAATPDTACKAKACCKADAKEMMRKGCEQLNIETVTLEAANGDPIAQYTLAYMTDEGINTTKDTEKAHNLYKDALPALEKAARDGHAGACRALVHMYAEGKGVEKDAAKSAEYKEHLKKCNKCCAPKADTEKPAADAAMPNNR